MHIGAKPNFAYGMMSVISPEGGGCKISPLDMQNTGIWIKQTKLPIYIK